MLDYITWSLLHGIYCIMYENICVCVCVCVYIDSCSLLNSAKDTSLTVSLLAVYRVRYYYILITGVIISGCSI